MCFSLAWAMYLCIDIVIVVAVWSIIQLLLPYLNQYLPQLVIQIIRIVLFAVIAIIIIYIIFGLISCLLGTGSGLFPLHR